MCELMLVSLGNERLNKLMLYNLAVIDSTDSTNKDGFGFFSPKLDSVWKTKLHAALITNLGELLNGTSLGERPIMGHVRFASSYAVGSFAVNKLVDDEHAHPFDVGKYVLAHNGTLEFKDKKNEDKYRGKNVIDSQAFAMELADNDKPFLKALKETVELFDGKFAMLIYDRGSRNQYIVRGRSANLYKSDIKIGGVDCGYVINTAKADLEHALHLFKNQYELHGGNPVEWTVPVELEAESVFVATSKFIKKVGEIKETTRAVTYSDDAWTGAANRRTYGVLNEYEKMIEAAIALSTKNGLLLRHLDEMCMRIYAEPLLGLTDEEIRQFITLILPAICEKNFDKLHNKWKEIKEKLPVGVSEYEAAVKYNMQYPYFFNSVKKLRQVYNAVCVDVRRQEEVIKRMEKGVA